MKLLTSEQTKWLDQQTITSQNITSADLMERAAGACVAYLANQITREQTVGVLCGLGNNGGDGLVIARQLHQLGYEVTVFVINYMGKSSDDFAHNYKRLPKEIRLVNVQKVDDIQIYDVTIDAIFGTGLTRPLEGLYSEVVQLINNSGSIVYSIDIPSGVPMMPDFYPDLAVRATTVLSFEVPKVIFFLPEYRQWVGSYEIIEIGWDKDSYNQVETSLLTFGSDEAKNKYKPRNRFAHKGSMGRVQIIAGSEDMAGAAILCCRAALTAGCGLCTCYLCEHVRNQVQIAVPEAITKSVTSKSHLISFAPEYENQVTAAGPGLGTHPETVKGIRSVLKQLKATTIIDADALNALDENTLKELANHNDQLVLTPHPGEFNRLFGNHSSRWAQIQTAIQMAAEIGCYIVLKGAYTVVALPSGKGFINTSGTAALAKGGSGDVLTGMLAALCARDYELSDAILLAVYMHGKAGEIAEMEFHKESVLASDVIRNIPAVYRMLEN